MNQAACNTFAYHMEKKLSGNSEKKVGYWLLTGVVMIMVQVVLGGITRLTGSGLSITEWAPILGAFPPMNDQSWQEAFDKYKQIGQYKHINFDFTLSDFKSIYFWEWLHRLWGRLIGLVFIFPFIYFLYKKMIGRKMIIPLIILFLLGGLQAAIGWIMVKSGLNKDDVSVDHMRLCIHFIAALILLCYNFWFALQFLVPQQERLPVRKMHKLNLLVFFILVLQLIYGAFMAGLKAGSFAPTWPTMNGSWWPEPTTNSGGLSNIVNDPITVQFIHRSLAYLLLIVIIIWTLTIRKIPLPGWLKKTGNLPLILVLFQLILGIATVLNSPDKKELVWWGVSHQFVAMLLLLSITWMYYLLLYRRK